MVMCIVDEKHRSVLVWSRGGNTPSALIQSVNPTNVFSFYQCICVFHRKTVSVRYTPYLQEFYFNFQVQVSANGQHRSSADEKQLTVAMATPLRQGNRTPAALSPG